MDMKKMGMPHMKKMGMSDAMMKSPKVEYDQSLAGGAIGGDRGRHPRVKRISKHPIKGGFFTQKPGGGQA